MNVFNWKIRKIYGLNDNQFNEIVIYLHFIISKGMQNLLVKDLKKNNLNINYYSLMSKLSFSFILFNLHYHHH